MGHGLAIGSIMYLLAVCVAVIMALTLRFELVFLELALIILTFVIWDKEMKIVHSGN